MRKLMFATKINGTEETGIVDIKSQRVFCLCTKEIAGEILKSLKQDDYIDSRKQSLKVILKDCFVAGEEFKVGVDNTIARMEKRIPYSKEDLSVKNFNQWYEVNEVNIHSILLGNENK